MFDNIDLILHKPKPFAMLQKTQIRLHQAFFSCLVFCFIIVLVNSCKKADILDSNTNKETIEETPQNFFNLPANASPILKRIANELQRQNKSKEFITAFIEKEGFPIWAKSKIERHARNGNTASFDGDGLEDTTVYIPLVVCAEQYVTGFLKATIDDSIDINIYRQNDYVNFPFKTPQSSTNVTTAEEFAVRMMTMDRDVFGSTTFQVPDKRLFNNSTDYSDTAGFKRFVTLNNSSSGGNGEGGGFGFADGTTISNYEYEVCYTIYILTATQCPQTFSGSGTNNTTGGSCFILSQANLCITYETGGGGPGGPGGPGGGGGTWPFPPSGPGGGGAPCVEFGPSITNSIIPIECNPSGGNPWPPLPPVIQSLKTLLDLNPMQINWLISNLNLATKIFNYLNNGGTPQLAKDHINAMMEDGEYLQFVEEHLENGDNTKMWWVDDQWIVQNMSIKGDGEDAPLENPTLEELALLKLFPVQGYKIYRNASKAETETISKFGVNGINDKSDAFRHAYWLALNTKRVGATLALLFSTAHEENVSSKFQKEKTMDLHNNSVGISLCTSSSLTNAQLATACMNAVTVGTLWYLSPINYSDPCFWTCPGNSTGNHGITTQTQVIPTNQ